MNERPAPFSPFWDRALELLLRFLGVGLTATAFAAGGFYVFAPLFVDVPVSTRQQLVLGSMAGSAGVGLAGAAYWTWREQAFDAPWLHGLFQTIVRYLLAFIFTMYGFAKLYRTQLYEPYLQWLDTPLGELSGFELTWAFFGTSFAYTAFIGLTQIVCAVLLCFRRTQLLGALALLPIIGNIVFVNFAYDIPVKLFSSLYLVMAVYLILSDARPLKSFFWDRRSVALPVRPPVLQPRPRVRYGLKVFLLLAICGFSLWRFESTTRARPRVEHAVYGIWNVVSIRPEAVRSPADQWDRLVFEANFGGDRASVMTSGARVQGRYEIDAADRSLSIDFQRAISDFEGHYRKISPRRLQLVGRVGADSLTLRLQRIERAP